MVKEPNIPKYFYGLLLIIGIILYIGWGILYGRWWDQGLYAVTVILIGFGIVGVLLYR